MKADRVMAFLDSHWNVALLHPQVVRGLALYGTMFSYTRWSTSAPKYGTTPVPVYEVQNAPLGPAYYQCQRCGAETMAEEAQVLAASRGQALPEAAAGLLRLRARLLDARDLFAQHLAEFFDLSRIPAGDQKLH
jgi:hypothetical protein